MTTYLDPLGDNHGRPRAKVVPADVEDMERVIEGEDLPEMLRWAIRKQIMIQVGFF